jgi:hypothetical protein
VGASGSDNNDGNYLNNSYDATDNENYAAPTASKRMWVFMNLPPSTTITGTPQNVTVTLTAQASN